MDQRVSLITLGVNDLAASKGFYEQLGWQVGLEVEETVFYQAGGMIVALWIREKLAEDGGLGDSGGWGGITLALNVGSAPEVDDVIEQARSAGARIGREPAATVWGGYTGVFLDLDGHPWEVAWNPGFVIEHGETRLQGSRRNWVEFPVPLTPRAEAILRRAADEARSVGATDYIGVEHIFLAIAREGESVPASLMRRFGILDTLESALEQYLVSNAPAVPRPTDGA